MEGLGAPTELQLTGNVAENWQVFMTATEPTAKRNDRQKTALLLHVAGVEAQEVYSTFQLGEQTTPSQLLMGRRLWSPIPDFAPCAPSPAQKRSQRRDLGSTQVPLGEGQVVRIRYDRGWNRKAEVQRGVAPRSYIVSTEDGLEWRRNRVHLRPTYEDFVLDADHPET
ncbi:hypothetical protein HPB47_002259, partial [Ixodes persulcatus]